MPAAVLGRGGLEKNQNARLLVSWRNVYQLKQSVMSFSARELGDFACAITLTLKSNRRWSFHLSTEAEDGSHGPSVRLSFTRPLPVLPHLLQQHATDARPWRPALGKLLGKVATLD